MNLLKSFCALLLGAGLDLPALGQDSRILHDLDIESYRHEILHLVDSYNGGFDGKSGTGAYRSDFNGHFHIDLDPDWQQSGSDTTTSIAQSRQLFANTLAYQAAGGGDKDRFFQVTDKAMIHLVKGYKDVQRGGFYAAIDSQGRVVDAAKDDFGNCQVLLALSAAYGVTRYPWQLREAMWQLELLRSRYRDPQHPPGFLPSFSWDFSSHYGYRNIECITHAFEGMLVLHDVVDSGNEPRVREAIQELGDFVVGRVYRQQAGRADSGYVSYYYDDQWNPTSAPFSAASQWAGGSWASPGHAAEIAFLLSRAVERGFANPQWLTTGDHLMRFALSQGYDWVNGGLAYETVDYDGQPYANDPGRDILEWWPQAELARALIHFAVVRGRSDYMPIFKQHMAFIHDHFADMPSGAGWYREVRRDWYGDAWHYSPETSERGTTWFDAYHEAMMASEVLRLDQIYH